MKRLLMALGLMSLAVGASAQTMYDALKYAQDDYYGTAKSMALGNALTAVGGDLGAVSINPAGSATQGWSQISITPAVNIAVCTAQGTTLDGDSSPFCFASRLRNTSTRMAMPSIGFILNADTGRKMGLKSYSVGFIANSRSYFNDNTYASGQHNGTTISGYMASLANGVDYTLFNSSSAYDNCAWAPTLAWKSGMICTAGSSTDQYVGAAEKFVEDSQGNRQFYAAGAVDQDWGRLVSGRKTDYIFNGAINVSDMLYVGANIGITQLGYDYDDYIKESAVDLDDFEVDFGTSGKTNFKSLKYQTWYTAEGTGMYAKLGLIATPGPVRLGFAIQTPTFMEITEQWGSSAETNYTNSSFNGSASTPEGEFHYALRTPMHVTSGIACAIAGKAVVSADYEFSSNKMLKFSGVVDYGMTDDMGYANDDMRNCFGSTHQLRAGLEVKPVDWLSLRGGYVLDAIRSGNKAWSSSANSYVAADRTVTMDHTASCGIGFSTKGSFFADLACRALIAHKEYIYPYSDYDYDSAGNILHYTPEILARRCLVTAAVTLGYRF